MMLLPIPKPDDAQVIYRGREGWPYRPDPRLVHAANAALTLGVPLLLTGEPGSGKTDFAFAIARWRHEDAGGEAELLECYVRSDTRARDLLYHYDAIRRFGDAYHGGEDGLARAQDSRNYIDLMPLGRALASAKQRVLLVDEIDKAPRDLPNDLLRELDQGEFEIAEIETAAEARFGARNDRVGTRLSRTMGKRHRAVEERPIIVVTSNAERQLPDAFLRRCVYFHIPFPGLERIRQMLADRFESKPGGDHLLRDAAARTYVELSKVKGLIKPPATSELLAWVRVLLEVASPEQRRVVIGFANATLSWAEVPYLECLIKLKQDLDKLARPRVAT